MNNWNQQPLSYLPSVYSTATSGGLPSQQPILSRSLTTPSPQYLQSFSTSFVQRPLLRHKEYFQSVTNKVKSPSRHIEIDTSDFVDDFHLEGTSGNGFIPMYLEMGKTSTPSSKSKTMSKNTHSLNFVPPDSSEFLKSYTSVSNRTDSKTGLLPPDTSEILPVGSGNITESVRVGSSFDVAEIVGKQGKVLDKLLILFICQVLCERKSATPIHQFHVITV